MTASATPTTTPVAVGTYVTDDWVVANDPLVYRHSTGESMGLCPMRVALSTKEGFIKESSEPMSFGGCASAMIKDFLVADDTERQRLVLKYASTEGVLARWREACEPDGYVLDEVCPRMKMERSALELARAFSLWRDWYDSQGRYLSYEAVERKAIRILDFLPDGRPVVLQGTADLVLTGSLWDWKTSGRPWEPGKAFTRQQAPLYVWLNEDIIGVRDVAPFTFMVYDRKSGHWQYLTVKVTPAQVEAALEIACLRALQIHTGAMPATPFAESRGKMQRGWYCSAQYCGGWEICTAKAAIADNTNLSARIPTRWDL